MDYSMAPASEAAMNPSGSPNSSSLYPSSDPVVDNSVKIPGFEVDGNKNEASRGSSDGAFVSGEKEFEAASEMPVVQGKSIGGGEKDTPFFDTVEFSVPKSEDQLLKVGDIGNDENKVAVALKDAALNVDGLVVDQGTGIKVVGAASAVEKNGTLVVPIEQEVVEKEVKEIADNSPSEVVPEKLIGDKKVLKDGEAVDGAVLVTANKVVRSEDGNMESKTLEPGSDELVETNGVKLTSGGDSVVEAVHIDLLGSGAAVVGDVEESKDVESKGEAASIDENVAVDNDLDKISRNAKVESIFSAESKMDVVTENQAAEVDPSEGVDAPHVESNRGNGFPEVEPDGISGNAGEDVGNSWDISEIQVGSSEGGHVGAADRKEYVETEGEPEADTESKQIDPAIKTVPADEKVEGGDGDGNETSQTVGTYVAHGGEQLEDDQTHVDAVPRELEDEVTDKSVFAEYPEGKMEDEDEGEEKHIPEGDGEIEGSATDGETEGMIFGSSEAAKKLLEELERGSGSYSGGDSSHDQSQRFDGQIVTDSDEEADTDDEGDGKEPFDSAALAALLKAATGAGSDGGTITVTSQDGSRLFSVERPAGLGSSLRSVKPAPRSNRPNLFSHSVGTPGADSDTNLSDEEKKKLEKLQELRVKFLRLVHRLGYSPEETVAAQVLYRLALLAGRQTNQLFSLDAAKTKALQLEAEGNDDLDFSLNLLVLGKTGVGKSATINSIFGEEKTPVHAFGLATTSIKEINGTVDGVKIKVIDSPGLKCSGYEQGLNRKVLSSVKRFIKSCPPDVVLYVDRLDTQTRDLNDLPLLRSITSNLGSSIWRNAIVTLTHGASAPPDGPSGSPLSYEVFVAQRSHLVQQSIGQAVGDLRLMNPSLMNPVSLVENHPSCRKNRDGQKVLPNGQTWRSQLLLLCYSMKILSEASSLSKPQDAFDHRKLFGFRSRSPPLPYLLSWLLQSRTYPKLATDQGADNVDSDIDLGDLSESDQEEEEDEYDQLPPFKPLRKAQIAKLSKEQSKAYFEEYDYRFKLLQKKQWSEELRRMREMKRKGKAAAEEFGYNGEDADPENEGPAAVPVPLPDMVLPLSFDSDNPAYRYRFLEPTSQFLARPVLDNHGWDHDCGYDGVNVEQSLAVANQFPTAITVQVTKDKKEFNIHLDSSISAKHGENGSSMAGFDIQNVGKQLAYIVRGETKFKNLKKNKTSAGISVTFLGENVATGVKLEDQIALGKRLVLVGSTGTVRSKGDSAYGANLEVRLREADYPIGQDQSSLGLSLVKWRGDLALGANLQSQFSVGRSSKIAVRAGLNNKMSGQITVRTSSSDQLQLALVSLLPIAMTIYKRIWPGANENYSMY